MKEKKKYMKKMYEFRGSWQLSDTMYVIPVGNLRSMGHLAP
jgi:hypothetical protein